MSFDLEKAREISDRLHNLQAKNRIDQVNANVSVNPPCYESQIQETLSFVNESALLLPDALDEISGLQEIKTTILKSLGRPHTASHKGTILYIEEDIKFLQELNKSQADRIKELEEHIIDHATKYKTDMDELTGQIAYWQKCYYDLIELNRKEDGAFKLALGAKDRQIATLKSALTADREELILYSPSYSVWRYQNNIDRIESQEDSKPIEAKAKEELAQEYPDIFKEE